MSVYVYRVYGPGDTLLYVGHSANVDKRMAQHKADCAYWWLFHTRVATTEYPDRATAAAAEDTAIFDEHPRWNMKGRDPLHPDGYADNVDQAPWLAFELEVSRAWHQTKMLEADAQRLLASYRTRMPRVERDIARVKESLARKTKTTAQVHS